MSITSGFFDSVEGDRRYDAEQMTTYFEGLVSDGIYENIGEAFIVKTAGEGLTITVGSGRALCKTHWIKNDAPITFTLSPPNVQYTRVDSVFIRYDANARTVDVVVVEGTPSANPVAPVPTRTDEIWDLYLANIRIDKNTSVISQGQIADYRASNMCGWVTGIIKQVDTSELFLQWQTAYESQFEEFDSYLDQMKSEFEDWYRALTTQLRVDTTIHKYQNSYQITSAQASANKYAVGIPEYNAENDILLVVVDGIMLIEGVDFKILDWEEHYPDVNDDGIIDGRDASAILTAAGKIAIGEPSGLTPKQEKAADANMDGIIDQRDATFVLTFYSSGAEDWTEYFEEQFGITIDSKYYMVPINGSYRAGSQLTFIVIKSVIGEGAEGGIPHIILTQAEYDALPEHDENALYIISD